MKRLRTGIVRADWMEINPILRELLEHLCPPPGVKIPKSRKKRTIDVLLHLLSVYRFALSDQEILPSDAAFRLPLEIILHDYLRDRRYCRLKDTLPIPVERLLAAFIGLNTLWSSPAPELADVFNRAEKEIENQIGHTAVGVEGVRDIIRSARAQIGDLYTATLDREKGHKKVVFPDTQLGCAVESYLQGRSRETLVLNALRELVIEGTRTDEEIFQILWEVGDAYIRKCKEDFQITIRTKMHNLENEAERWKLPRDLLLMKFRAMHRALSTMIIDNPHDIKIRKFLLRLKRDLEKALDCPGGIGIKKESRIKAYFDKERLYSVLEACALNAFESVERYNRMLHGEIKLFRKPMIIIGVHEVPGEGMIEIVVEDNGTGLQEDPRITGRGFGTYMMIEYVENVMNGKVRWENRNRFDPYKGARVILHIPAKGATDAENISDT